LQNENRNPAKPEIRETLAAEASRKPNLQPSREPEYNERKRYEDLREEDPERWDGMS